MNTVHTMHIHTHPCTHCASNGGAAKQGRVSGSGPFGQRADGGKLEMTNTISVPPSLPLLCSCRVNRWVTLGKFNGSQHTEKKNEIWNEKTCLTMFIFFPLKKKKDYETEKFFWQPWVFFWVQASMRGSHMWPKKLY